MFPGAALWELLGVDQDDAGGTKGPPGTAHSPLVREAHPGVQQWAWSVFTESEDRSLCFKHGLCRKAGPHFSHKSYKHPCQILPIENHGSDSRGQIIYPWDRSLRERVVKFSGSDCLPLLPLLLLTPGEPRQWVLIRHLTFYQLMLSV